MTKKEKVKLEKAIELLFDDGNFHEAISILFGLLGRKWHVWEALNDPELKSVDVRELWNRPNQEFKIKIKPEWIK